jgi:hypothetical protein
MRNTRLTRFFSTTGYSFRGASLTPHGCFHLSQDAEPFMTKEQKARVREISLWLGTSDAGQALWKIHFGDPFQPFQPGAPGTVQPNRTVSVAVESENIDIFGDIDKLREQLKDFY